MYVFDNNLSSTIFASLINFQSILEEPKVIYTYRYGSMSLILLNNVENYAEDFYQKILCYLNQKRHGIKVKTFWNVHSYVVISVNYNIVSYFVFNSPHSQIPGRKCGCNLSVTVLNLNHQVVFYIKQNIYTSSCSHKKQESENNRMTE